MCTHILFRGYSGPRDLSRFAWLAIMTSTHTDRPRYLRHTVGRVTMRCCTSYRPGGGETIFTPPMAVRLAADLRPSAVRTSLVAGQLQAASVPLA